MHLTGNLNHYIGAIIAGTGYVRHREHEFTDPEKYPRDELLGNFIRPSDLVVRTLESQDDAGFATPVAEQLPIQTRLGLFLVCAAHLNNHIGQMSYLVQALQRIRRNRRCGEDLVVGPIGREILAPMNPVETPECPSYNNL